MATLVWKPLRLYPPNNILGTEPSSASEFQPLPLNNPFRLQEASQPAPKRPTVPRSRSFRHRGTRANRQHNATHASQSIYDGNGRPTTQTSWDMPPPLMPSRVSHYYGDARDFLPPEQQQISTPTLNSQASLPLSPRRSLLQRSLGPAWGPESGPSFGVLPGNTSGHGLSNSNASGIADASRGTRSSTVNPPFDTDHTNSLMTGRGEAGPNDFGPLLSNPLTGSFSVEDDDEDVIEIPHVLEPPQGPTAIIMDDNYNIYNDSLLARLFEECENGPFKNTAKSIATYHQLMMADDLYYGGIWKGRFMLNQEDIIEYHKPAPSCPKGGVYDEKRRDRRRIFVWLWNDIDGVMEWAKVVGWNKVVGTTGMKSPSAEFDGVLDLWKYFFNRVPCATPDVHKYAQLVAPQYIDVYHAEVDEETARPRLQAATAEEASSLDAMSIPNLISPTDIDPDPSDTWMQAPPLATVPALDPPSAQSMPGTVVPPNAPHPTYPYPPHFDLLPNLSVVPSDMNMPTCQVPHTQTGRIWTAIDSSRPYVSPYTSLGQYLGDVTMTESADLIAGEDMDLDTTDLYARSSNALRELDISSGPQPTAPMDLYDPYSAGAAPGTEDYSSFVDLMDFQEATGGMNSFSPEPEPDWIDPSLFDEEDFSIGASFNNEIPTGDGQELGYDMFDSSVFDDFYQNDNDVTKSNKGANEDSDEGAGDSSRMTTE
ncbi:hypothetical protein GGR58DRAFT_524332 [Xylaria digitata]|nr:hypothetical protein GGR58DRAFT_524332 [Xylaria digitata]